MDKQKINIDLNDISLPANLSQSCEPAGLVIFAHGSGSSHLNLGNNYVAAILNQHHISTLVVDLLSPEEDQKNENRFNIDLLTDRLIGVTEKVLEQLAFDDLPIGFFGASTGVASALNAAAFLQNTIKAIVCRGGRTDLAKNIQKVKAPTLLIVGSLDTQIINLNEHAYNQLQGEKQIEIIEGATHLFEESGALESVGKIAANWFELHLWHVAAEQRTH